MKKVFLTADQITIYNALKTAESATANTLAKELSLEKTFVSKELGKMFEETAVTRVVKGKELIYSINADVEVEEVKVATPAPAADAATADKAAKGKGKGAPKADATPKAEPKAKADAKAGRTAKVSPEKKAPAKEFINADGTINYPALTPIKRGDVVKAPLGKDKAEIDVLVLYPDFDYWQGKVYIRLYNPTDKKEYWKGADKLGKAAAKKAADEFYKANDIKTVLEAKKEPKITDWKIELNKTVLAAK